MPGADDLMMRIYAAMAQRECELISERTRAALAVAKARGTALGGNTGYRPPRALTPPQRPKRDTWRRSERRTGWRLRWSGYAARAWSVRRRRRGR